MIKQKILFWIGTFFSLGALYAAFSTRMEDRLFAFIFFISVSIVCSKFSKEYMRHLINNFKEKSNSKGKENTEEVNFERRQHLLCKKCGSDNISIQIVNNVKVMEQHHNFLWWIFIGWWWIPIKWFFLTIPALIFKIFGIGKKHKIINEEEKRAICQKCGYDWLIK